MATHPTEEAPKLEFDFEERIFGRLWRWWRGHADQAERVGAVDWAPLSRRLGLVASVFAGRPARLVAASGVGGTGGERVLVPCPFRVVPREDVEVPATTDTPMSREALSFEALLLRVVIGGALLAESERLTWHQRLARALERLDLELPGLAARRAAVLAQSADPAVLWGRPVDGGVAEETDAGALPPDAGAAPDAEGTERSAPTPDSIELATLDPDKPADPLLTPAVEQVQTADEYRGGHRTLDGEDELADHADALEEVDMRVLLRGGAGVGSVYQADLDGMTLLGDDAPAAGEGLPFDEWDGRKRAYRKAWARVVPVAAPDGDRAWIAEALTRRRRTIRDVWAQTHDQLRKRQRLGRQLQGPEIDVSAVVEAHANRLAGRTPSPRLYVAPRPRKRELAVTLLLDQSLSAAAWVEGTQVLELVRDAALVLGEVAWSLDDELRVLSFCSHTRHRCEVAELKGWGERWPDVRHKLAGMTPRGYTRLGPALRYATAGLRRHPARDRLLLVITDGKPTDHDRYEGRYGISDVRQAVREAERDRVAVRALCIAKDAGPALAAQFGAGRWRLLPHASALPGALGEALGRWHTG